MDQNNYDQNSGENQNSWQQPQQPQQPQQQQWEQQQQTQWEQQQQTQWGQQQQPQWQQQAIPPYQQNQSLSVGQWILTFLIQAIPCLNIIMLFVWGFGSETEPRKNWARATLVMMAIAVVFSILFSSLIAATLKGMAY